MSETAAPVKKQARRNPSQKRSRTRVDAILNATRDIVSEKGAGGLKIHELADRAGVTPSSIYQYFPNKRAILQALDKRYIDTTNELIRVSLSGIENLDQGFDALEQMLDEYYEWYKSEPVITDIWYGLASDKVMNNSELQVSRDSAGIIMEALSPFVDESKLAELESYALLMTHLAGNTIRLCLMTEEAESRKLLSSFKMLLRNMSQTLSSLS
ncbi:TetR/AcrR family transcriptional regulator [Endozoicomonas ascidiicola]|uniref:TetR/AcrR family transcriptional regulator n=1 Tax=Endozoicomonas ascidiicola TaxID=1698521 RepID=UPI00082AFCC6|nr:TetR/AcrR family transcriptional regulator [Endozoicomonas ascidiicola]